VRAERSGPAWRDPNALTTVTCGDKGPVELLSGSRPSGKGLLRLNLGSRLPVVSHSYGSGTSAGRRGETEAERDDRNLIELLQELRVAGLGVRVLFGFMLSLPFYR
jgi:Family of unknown function (DUF6328)